MIAIAIGLVVALGVVFRIEYVTFDDGQRADAQGHYSQPHASREKKRELL
ncbi:hypothetical protein VOM14_13360 [Paraburkholderia sp. MPAMCS5]|nr:hypothetical protein [Paraburkholderia sp. MPAMCS5]